MSIIVETHDGLRPGALALMMERFSPTHDITRVDQQPKMAALPQWIRSLSQPRPAAGGLGMAQHADAVAGDAAEGGRLTSD